MNTKLKSLIENIIKEEFVAEKKKAKKDETEDISMDIDMPAEEPADTSTEAPADTTPNVDMGDTGMEGTDSTEKQVGKGLQMALDAAKQLPDSENKSKLIRQIGNTALFFLKTQIPGTGEQM
jgi:hypothetical protein